MVTKRELDRLWSELSYSAEELADEFVQRIGKKKAIELMKRIGEAVGQTLEWHLLGLGLKNLELVERIYNEINRTEVDSTANSRT